MSIDSRTLPAGGDKLGYVRALDGVRAASILFVLAAHTAPLGPKAWQLNAMSGRIGMALFFCLSGYLITSILWAKPAVGPFMVKRLTRIVPAVFLYLTVLLLFFDLPFAAYWRNLLFVSNYLTSYQDSGPISHLWSLCVEIHFYLAVGLAVLIGGRRALWLIPPAAVVITLLRAEAGVISSINTHLRVDEILVGGCLALVSIHCGDRLRAGLADNRVAVPVLVVLAGLVGLSSHDEGGVYTLFRPYFSMALVGVAMHCQWRPLTSVLESRPAAYIARISYALYIWHPLMIFGVMNSGTTMERYLFKRPISYLLTWAAAHLSTYYWERRWQDLARDWLRARERP